MLKNFGCFLLFCVILSFFFLHSYAVNQDSKIDGKFTQYSKGRSRPKNLSSNKMLEIAGLTNIKQIMKDVKEICIERVVGTEGHDKVRNYIIDSFKSIQWKVEEDIFEDETPYGRKTFSNIIVSFPESEESSNKNIIILAAHYDSKFFDSFHFVGAFDSAVSCALLIDIARSLSDAFKNTVKKPKLKIIFFDGEEAFKDWTEADSLYGSRHLAKLWSNSEQDLIKQIESFILLDLIGASKPRIYSYHEPTQWLFDRLVVIEKKLKGINILNKATSYFALQKIYNADLQDDHTPFFKLGVSCLHLMPLPFPTTWHQEGDNFENLDQQVISDFATILRIFVIEYFSLRI